MENKTDWQIIKGTIENENVPRSIREIFDWGSSIIYAMAICSFITLFVMLFTVSGESMLPTLHDGDKLFVNKFMYTPKKGDIVTINTMDKINKTIVKRVIATAGDSFKIDYDTHEVYVNGKVLDEPYIYEPTKVKADWNIPATIPKGHVLVLGDNRNHSLDSRFNVIGLVRIDELYGRAFMIYWPFDRIKTFN